MMPKQSRRMSAAMVWLKAGGLLLRSRRPRDNRRALAVVDGLARSPAHRSGALRMGLLGGREVKRQQLSFALNGEETRASLKVDDGSAIDKLVPGAHRGVGVLVCRPPFYTEAIKPRKPKMTDTIAAPAEANTKPRFGRWHQSPWSRTS